MKKNYNLHRTPLLLPEYGRHIHDMVENLLLEENRDERNKKARTLISVMGNLQPHLRDSADSAHKLWDHLFVMSNFKLDVDSPYPIPTAETLALKPAPMKYPSGRINMKHYGKNVKNVIRRLESEGNQAVVQAVINNIARYMRTKSYEYNQEHPLNEVIIKDIKRMTENGIILNEDAIHHIKSEYKQPFVARGKKSSFTKKGGKTQKSNNQRRNYMK